jgi:broad specificity phosphatase PhoE
MSTIVYLLRHAEYDNPRHILPGRLPVELSKKGLAQVKKLHDYFVDKKITKIFSSAVLRCRQTSEIISSKKIPIEFDKRLVEVLCAYQGYWVENSNLYYWMRESLGGELNIDVQNRMVDFWKSANFEDGKNYIVSSHGDGLYFLHQYLTGVALSPELPMGKNMQTPNNYPPMGGFYIVEKENGVWESRGILKEY